MNCVRDACNVRDSSQLDVNKINAMALTTLVAARGRNETMSAVAYRIPAILFHSGVKHEDLRILNKLGVCMSPDMIVQIQRKMSECCESKVGHWKREIEKAKVASLLLNEVQEKQVGNHEKDVMCDDIDFSEETIRKYDFFKPAAFQFCLEHINRFSDEQDIITDQELGAAAAEIAKIQLPYYRYIILSTANDFFGKICFRRTKNGLP